MGKNKSNFVVQGTILAAAGILVRIIGVIYRIPLRQTLGSTAMGYYSTAYDVYSLFLLLSSMSMPLAVSKIVSARVAKRQMKNAYRAFIGAMIFSVIIGLVFSLSMYFGAGVIADFSKYSEAKLSLQILAPTLFIMSILGVMRGYFQGLGTMIPTAISQVLEQIANCILSIVCGIYLMKVGDELGQGEAYASAGVTIGTLAGATTALIFFIFVFFMYRGMLRRQMKRDLTEKLESYGGLTKVLFFTIVPVLLSTTIYNFSNLFDSVIFGNIMSGYYKIPESEYTSTWGIYSSEYRLLTNVPVAVASALASAIIPSLVRSVNEGNKRQVLSKIDTAIRFVAIIAIPVGIGLSMMAGPVLYILFPDPQTYNQSVHLMRLAIFTVLAFSISTITNGILQGIDRMKTTVINASIALGIHLVLIFVILYVFNGGIVGVVISDISYGIIICLLNIWSLYRYTGYRQELLKTFILPGISACIMGIFAYTIHHFMNNALENAIGLSRSNLLSTGVAVFAAVIIYFALLLALRAVGEDELRMFPKGEILIRIARKIHLL